MDTLFIIRGLPGSGKTTLAQIIAEEFWEADMFFERNGTYQYDKEQLEEAHRWCQHKVKRSMEDGIMTVVVSNTFGRRWMMEPYYEMAKMHDYQVIEVTMTGELRRSVHNVPDESIERMRADWEK